MKEYFGFFAVFLTTLCGTEIFRRWSLRKELFDVPNERSSHTVPTPRGGGLIIVIVCLTAYIFWTLAISGNFQWSYLIGAFLIASVSWIDDLYTISSGWRFTIHTTCAALAVFTLGYFDEINIPFLNNFKTGIFGASITFFWIVWLTNAYNFMDGIDGIAGTQALTAGIGWFLLGQIVDAPTVSFYGGILACAGLGFLILNWQPAKIFMGDVGSAFLGYSFAVLPLLAKNESGANLEKADFLFPAAIILVWLFAFDTLWTFGRRVLNGEKVWQAHRSHLYQRLVISGKSHSAVTFLYGTISILNVFSLVLYLRKDYPEAVLPAFLIVQSAGLVFITYYFAKQK